MKRSITILVGILAVLVGAGLIMPALAKLRSGMGGEAWPLPVEILLVLAGMGAVVYGVAKRKAKTLERA